MGGLTNNDKAILRVAFRDALAGRNVLILVGSARHAGELFDFVSDTYEAEFCTLYTASRLVVSPKGGALRFEAIRNFRDLERLRGQGVDAFASLNVQRRFVDLLKPWLTARGAKFYA